MKYTIKSSGETFETMGEARDHLRKCGLCVVFPWDFGSRMVAEPESYAIADEAFGGYVDRLLCAA